MGQIKKILPALFILIILGDAGPRKFRRRNWNQNRRSSYLPMGPPPSLKGNPSRGYGEDSAPFTIPQNDYDFLIPPHPVPIMRDMSEPRRLAPEPRRPEPKHSFSSWSFDLSEQKPTEVSSRSFQQDDSWVDKPEDDPWSQAHHKLHGHKNEPKPSSHNQPNSYSTLQANGNEGPQFNDFLAPPPMNSNNFYNSPSLTIDVTPVEPSSQRRQFNGAREEFGENRRQFNDRPSTDKERNFGGTGNRQNNRPPSVEQFNENRRQFNERPPSDKERQSGGGGRNRNNEFNRAAEPVENRRGNNSNRREFNGRPSTHNEKNLSHNGGRNENRTPLNSQQFNGNRRPSPKKEGQFSASGDENRQQFNSRPSTDKERNFSGTGNRQENDNKRQCNGNNCNNSNWSRDTPRQDNRNHRNHLKNLKRPAPHSYNQNDETETDLKFNQNNNYNFKYPAGRPNQDNRNRNHETDDEMEFERDNQDKFKYSAHQSHDEEEQNNEGREEDEEKKFQESVEEQWSQLINERPADAQNALAFLRQQILNGGENPAENSNQGSSPVSDNLNGGGEEDMEPPPFTWSMSMENNGEEQNKENFVQDKFNWMNQNGGPMGEMNSNEIMDDMGNNF